MVQYYFDKTNKTEYINMISAPPTADEEERLNALNRLEILDTLEEQAYDDLTLLAAQICDTPIALVSLIDEERQWFKSHHGLDVCETPKDVAFCAHAIHGDGLFMVEDSENDERFHDNPLVTDAPHVKFYAGFPLYIEGKYPVGTLCVIDDHARELSDIQKQALEALSRQVVSQLELRLKVKQLMVLDDTKDKFISMVSHELRTPLTSIVGSLSLLTNTMADQIGKEALAMTNIAYRNGKQLINIVNDILDVTKIDAGKLELNIAKHNLYEVVNEAVELNMPYLNKCECNVNLESKSDHPVFVNIDKDRIIQVMNNLISNAAKFTKTNDTIVVSIDTEDDFAKVSIIDHGFGIKDSNKPAVFERFVQSSDNVNQKLPGTGLGLNLCKSIIEKHNGIISFESTVNVGSEFYFKLPL